MILPTGSALLMALTASFVVRRRPRRRTVADLRNTDNRGLLTRSDREDARLLVNTYTSRPLPDRARSLRNAFEMFTSSSDVGIYETKMKIFHSPLKCMYDLLGGCAHPPQESRASPELEGDAEVTDGADVDPDTMYQFAYSPTTEELHATLEDVERVLIRCYESLFAGTPIDNVPVRTVLADLADDLVEESFAYDDTDPTVANSFRLLARHVKHLLNVHGDGGGLRRAIGKIELKVS